MADIQHAFLSKLVLTGELQAAVNARITPEFLDDPNYKRIYEFMLKHWRDYGTPPDEQVMQRAFPTTKWDDDPQPTSYYIDALRQRHKRSILMQALSDAADFVRSDDPDSTDDMEGVLQTALIRARLETATSYDIDLTGQRAPINEMLDMRALDPGYLRGISTGFRGIDYVTGGLQPEQFIVLLGTPKTFKSATALKIALSIHEQAKVPLFIGFEMSNVEQTDRTLSLISGISLTKIMNGDLSIRERRAIDAALKRLEDMRPLLFSADITATTTVNGIQAKVMEYQPDVVIVDGAYQLESDLERADKGSPQALTDISRSLKRLAQQTKIPVLATTQASLTRSKGGLTIASGMYTQAWGQDCDVLLGTERSYKEGEQQAEDETLSHDPVEVKFKVIASRSGPRKAVILEWDWHHGKVEEIDPAAITQSLSRSSQGNYQSEDDD